MSESSPGRFVATYEAARPGDLAERLEQLWRQGQQPDVDVFLAEAGPLPPTELATVLRADQRQRWEASERVPAEDYLRRHPAVEANMEAALDLIFHEFLLRERLGERPDVDEYRRRFPHHAEALAAQVALHRALAGRTEDGSGRVPLGAETLPALSSGGAEPARPEVPGYEILGELGRGGMGVVYQARQLGLNRVVALKVILAGTHAGEAELARFRTEAEAVARLQHPNVVQIHEVGQREGLPFFSLEYCPGGSLADRLDGTPWPAVRAAALVETLAHAVQAAHEQGVIHRDLKPANVLLASDGTPKITDFGLAKRLDVEAGQTQSGAIVGTPSYMAPEQAAGKGKAVGAAADVYALGAVLYECVTGRPPFQGSTVTDTILRVLSDEPPPPRKLNPAVPRDLETIALKCLRKEPGKRYASARELADDLRRFQQGEPIKARPLSLRERVWRRRRHLLVVGVALFVVALLGVGTHALLGWQRERRDREFNDLYTQGVQQFDRSQAREAIASFDAALLIRPHDPHALAYRGKAYIDLRAYDRALADSDEALRLDPENAMGYRVRGAVLLKLGRCEDAVASLTKALHLDPQAVIPRRHRARAYLRLQKWSAAERDLNYSLPLAPQDPALYELRSILRAAQKRWDDAVQDYSLMKPEGGPASILFARAAAALADGQEDRYREICGRLLKQVESIEGGGTEMTMEPVSPSRMAARAFALSEKPEIKPERLLDLAEGGPKVPGRPDNVFFLRIKALVWLRTGRVPKAVQQLEDGLKSHPDYSPGINHLLLSIAHKQMRQPEKADIAYRLAIEAGIPVNHVHDTLEYQVLLREARKARGKP
jgi:serine/threonine-protein kinase